MLTTTCPGSRPSRPPTRLTTPWSGSDWSTRISELRSNGRSARCPLGRPSWWPHSALLGTFSAGSATRLPWGKAHWPSSSTMTPGLWARGVGMLALARLVAGDAAFVLGSVPAAAEIARADGDALTEGWCRFVEGSVPPNDSVQMVAAYELGIKAPSPTLAAVAAANAATSGADDQPDVWLARMDDLESQTDNISVRAACDVARLELWIERGDLQGCPRPGASHGF